MGSVEAKQTLLSKPGNCNAAAPPPPNLATGCDKAVTLVVGGGGRGVYTMVLGNSSHHLQRHVMESLQSTYVHIERHYKYAHIE